MRSRPAVLACSAALILSGALASCSAATPADGPPATPAAQPGTTRPVPTDSPAALSPTDWTTYHRDAARTGAAPAGPAAGRLSIAWRRHLDGAVYGQPLAVGNLVIAATEGASNRLIDLEELSEREVEHVHQRFRHLFDRAQRLGPGERISVDTQPEEMSGPPTEGAP